MGGVAMLSEHVPATAAAALGVTNYLCVCSRVCGYGCEGVRTSAPNGGPAGRTRSGRRDRGDLTFVRALSSHDSRLDGKDDRGEEKMGCLLD